MLSAGCRRLRCVDLLTIAALIVGTTACDPPSPSRTSNLEGLTATLEGGGGPIVVLDATCRSDLSLTQFRVWETPQLGSSREGHLIATLSFSPAARIPRATVIDEQFFQEATLSPESPIDTFQELMASPGFSVTEDLAFADGTPTVQIIFVVPKSLEAVPKGQVLFGDDGIPMSVAQLCPTTT
jgi:hypothetical protein